MTARDRPTQSTRNASSATSVALVAFQSTEVLTWVAEAARRHSA